jgi:hypothetical protein
LPILSLSILDSRVELTVNYCKQKTGKKGKVKSTDKVISIYHFQNYMSRPYLKRRIASPCAPPTVAGAMLDELGRRQQQQIP